MNKEKVLLINPYIANYRRPIFNAIAKKFDLTILHSGEKDSACNYFDEKVISQIQIGPFEITKANLHKICSRYDVVISEGNIKYLDRNILALNKFRTYKWIYWGIGVSASYDKKFDEDKKFDFIRHFIFRHADANVFYSSYPVAKYLKNGFDKSELFVAHNTTQVSYDKEKDFDKNSLLFVGSLYKQKKIFSLLESYKKALDQVDCGISLNIIGDGEEFDEIKAWIDLHSLESEINLLGAIYDTEILEKYFRSALACISPGQAGLSVLTSMGYGTPFITQRNAITGGERLNIKNTHNGVLYNEGELTNIIIDIINNESKYIRMGKNARKYYLNKRHPKQMVDSLISAIEYVLK